MNDSPQPHSFLTLGLLELEAFVQALADEVEFGAVEVGQALRIDEDPDAVRTRRPDLRAAGVGELELVRAAPEQPSVPLPRSERALHVAAAAGVNDTG